MGDAPPPRSSDQPTTPADYFRHLNQHKFTVELEFLSSLASPAYLSHLNAQGHLHDPAFLRYLAHLLKTWSEPSYVRFLRFPNALLFARAIVSSPAFRQAIGTDGWENEVSREIIADWARQAQTNSNNESAVTTDDHDVEATTIDKPIEFKQEAVN